MPRLWCFQHLTCIREGRCRSACIRRRQYCSYWCINGSHLSLITSPPHFRPPQLNDDLTDLTKIMTQNIQDVLGRGEMIDSVAKKSSSLRQASSKYSKDAKYLNTQALLRKYAPVAVVMLLIGGGLWWRFF
mmetsp:Transcript_3937/g.12246  ORF Transcript_3937/g.12246 Transcript_3937/m.12246 type:complete len:131 (+) Transcript_3937:757-1149(+)